MSKRKSTELGDESVTRKKICIIHNEDSKAENFVHLKESSFQKICDIRDKRLSLPIGSNQRMEKECAPIPADISSDTGYHRDCYQKFTMNLKRLQVVENEETTCTKRTSRGNGKESTIFSPECIFCNRSERKKIKVKGTWTTEGTSRFDLGGGEALQRLVEERKDEDLARRIRGYDLFACEAQYHRSCRMNYNDRAKWRSKNEENKQVAIDQALAHDTCFQEICKVIDKEIVHEQNVVRLSELTKSYVHHLEETKFANPSYRTENLKRKISNTYSDKVGFVALDRARGKFQTDLLYSTETNLGTAIKNGYMLGSADHVRDVGLFLRNAISNAFEKANELPWPPTATFLEGMDDPLPPDLRSFLQVVISGNSTSVSISEKVERLVNSIGQDICRAVTNGKWKLPKHILLSMTLRHLFRSSQLNTLINRLGHAESYTFTLELETALAAALDKASDVLSTQIVGNPIVPSVFHSDFDNFDQFINNQLGSGSVHTAHGIMLQELEVDESNDPGGSVPTLPSLPKSGKRSYDCSSEDDLPACYVNRRISPVMKVDQKSLPGIIDAKKYSDGINLIWTISRLWSSAEDQEIPGWSGFISEIGRKPARLTTIDYYPVINKPITEYSTVQECLQYAEQGTKEVGQNYVITSFDLGVCMKAYPLVWSKPDRYKHHIITIGSFHLICAYLKMLGKKMDGTGLSDVLLESGLMTSGSLKGVLQGQNYSRAMYCHKALLEGLERMLLQKYAMLSKDSEQFLGLPPHSMEKLRVFSEVRNQANLDCLMSDKAIKQMMDGYEKFKEEMRGGKHGKTAQLWMSYLDHVWLVLSLLKAVKSNDYELYCYCLYHMADLFFSFDGQNYARYLTFFAVFLANIEVSHPGATDLLKRGAFSVARSFVSGNRCAVDKTIEETFMKHAKSHGGAGGCGAGVSGILSSYGAYQRWAKTTHERTRYVEATLSMADMLDADSINLQKHKECRPSQVRKSEKAVKKVVEAFQSLMNPFEVDDGSKLYSIASGAAASDEVTEAMMNAEEIGKAAKEQFINERLEKNERFFEPIKRQKLKRLCDMNKKTTVMTSKNQVVELKQQGNIALQLLIKLQRQDETVDLKELMSYPLMPVPSSIGTPDGFLAKTDKSKGFHYLIKGIEDAEIREKSMTMYIEDGNATFYNLKQLPSTFRGISEQIFDISTSGKEHVIFSTDMYFPRSVKSQERERRGCGEKRIIKGMNTRRPESWTEFLTNEENKKQLINVIEQTWEGDDFHSKLENKSVILINAGKASMLSSGNDGEVSKTEIPCLLSNQEETDTRVVLYSIYAVDNGFQEVCVRSPDSDIFFILLHFASTIRATLLFDTGAGNNRRILDITKIADDFTERRCTALLALHAFTRCDTTSAFKGIGKVKPIKIVEKNSKFEDVFCKLGQRWNVTDDVFKGLEEFTCSMYGSKRMKDVDEVRAKLIKRRCGQNSDKLDVKKNIDLAKLPPPRRCLREHIKRTNYQVAIWKRANIAIIDAPEASEDNGWVLVDGRLEPCWCDGEIIPTKMADILLENIEENTSDDDDEDSEEEEAEEESSDSEDDD